MKALHRTSLLRANSRTSVVLALLLGSLAVVRVASAQSSYLTAAIAMYDPNDTNGTVTATVPGVTVLDKALTFEAGQGATADSDLGGTTGDIAYILQHVGATNAQNEYAGFITAIGNSAITSTNFGTYAGSIATGFANNLAGSDSPTLTSDLSAIANKLDSSAEGPSVTSIAEAVAEAHSMANYSYLESIAKSAATALYVSPHSAPGAIPAAAEGLAMLPSITTLDQALIAEGAVANTSIPAATDASTVMGVEQVALGAPYNANPVTVAKDFSADVTGVTYGKIIASTAAAGQSATTAGQVGETVAVNPSIANNTNNPVAIFQAVYNSGISGGHSVDNLYDVGVPFSALPVADLPILDTTLTTTATSEFTSIVDHANTLATPTGGDNLVADLAAVYTHAIVADAMATPSGMLTSAQQTDIDQIVLKAISADPNGGPDILGFILDSFNGDTSLFKSTAAYNTFVSNLKSAADEADTNTMSLAVLKSIYSSLYGADNSSMEKAAIEKVIQIAYTAETTDMASNSGRSYQTVGYTNPDETPITDF